MKRRKHTRRRYWPIALGIFLAILVYVYLFATYAVFPFSNRWRAYFGNVQNPKGYSIYGIDISHHQGDIEWDKLEHATIDGASVCFVFIKATEGTTYLDENFNENFYQTIRHGFIRGAYHYYLPQFSAKEQAAHFLHQVHLEEGDLPPVLDIEEIGNKSKEDIRRDVLTWLTIVGKAYDTKPIIYTGFKFKTDYLNTEEFQDYPYWIAHYYVSKLGYKGDWRFWQYSDMGQLDGIGHKVDLNVYNGSLYDLNQLTLKSE